MDSSIVDNLRALIDKFTSATVKDARKNLASNKHSKHKRINTTGKLSKSVKGDYNGKEITFSFEDYGLNVDRGVSGQRKRILKNWNKSMFLPRGSGWNYAIKKGGGGISQMSKSIAKWQDKKPVGGSPFAITRSIQLNGLVPKLFFTDAFEPHYKEFLANFETELGKDVEELLKDE